jgi:outer membrane lipoprotein
LRRKEKMVHRKAFVFLLSTLLSLAMSGCAHIISSDMREKARADLTFPMVREDPDAYIGTIVIWGGVVDELTSEKKGSTLIVFERPLDSRDWPKANEDSRGKFLARTDQRLDLLQYQKGTNITLAGVVVGRETRSSDDQVYTYPVVEIVEIHSVREKYSWAPDERHRTLWGPADRPPYYGLAGQSGNQRGLGL